MTASGHSSRSAIYYDAGSAFKGDAFFSGTMRFHEKWAKEYVRWLLNVWKGHILAVCAPRKASEKQGLSSWLVKTAAALLQRVFLTF
jgi:hypothetical protein